MKIMINMNCKNRTISQSLVLVCALTWSAATIADPVLVSQEPADNADGLQSVAFDDQESADNFALSDAAVVTGVRWWGSFFDDGVSSAATDLFTVTIYGDDAGLPDTTNPSLFTSVFDASGITRTATLLKDIAEAPVFQFDVSLAGLALSAGDFYLSIQYGFDTTNAEFFWLFSDNQGSNFFRLIPGAFELSDGDFAGNLAFAILGEPTEVPEPGTLSLLLVGLSLLALNAFGGRRSKVATETASIAL
jgi:hypothetical protein